MSTSIRPSPGGWWLKNASWLKTTFRFLLGVVWIVDGWLKFQNDFVGQFPGVVQNAQANAPSWLSGWYSFWASQAANDPSAIVYTVGTLELALGLALVFGFLRKIAYFGGALLSLLIWAVPEGFGGSYGPGTTDIGTGAVYAMLFLGLIVINAVFGVSRFSLDYLLERRWPWWAKLAEMDSDPRPRDVSLIVSGGSPAPKTPG